MPPGRDGRAEHRCGAAEIAEWERIDQLLTALPAGTVYDPDVDDVVQAELAADATAAVREVELREAAERTARCAPGRPGRGHHGLAIVGGHQVAGRCRSVLGGPPHCDCAFQLAS
ncbi:hypothetical protein [Streptomyces sp. NPDC001594]|uniref:hypothetical protein n=1 Tax=Streptomyces sp. NPDC001594 TaxID=3364590 RepID=UPI003684F070